MSVAEEPLVSVIVPFLNPGRFLDEAIQSAFAQSYTCWELLLVDDGSDDGSSEIARRYAELHPEKVRTFEHEGHINLGLSASRNLGIGNARGELLAFLDADDVWLPHKLEHQVDILQRHPDVGLVCGPSLYWHSWARATDSVDRVVPVGAPQEAVSDPPRLLIELYPLGKGGAPCPTSILVRRRTCERVGGFEEHFRGMYEDQAFLSKIYLETPVFVSSLCCDYYRQHPSSMSSDIFRRGQYHAVRLVYLNWLESFLRERSYDRGEVWDALQRALCRYRHPIAWFLSEMRFEPRKQLRRIGSYMMRRSLPEAAYLWLRQRLAGRHLPKTAPEVLPDQPRQANAAPRRATTAERGATDAKSAGAGSS